MFTCFNWKVLWYMNQAGYHWISIYSNLTLRCLQLLCNHTEHFDVDTVEPRWRAWWSQVAWLYKGYVAGMKPQEKVEQPQAPQAQVFDETCKEQGSSKQHQAPLDAKPAMPSRASVSSQCPIQRVIFLTLKVRWRRLQIRRNGLTILHQ